MVPIDTKKHTKYTLELIFSEADKMAVQILKSISENRNKSFVVFAFITSLFSYSFLKTVDGQFDHFILLTGCVIALFILRRNFFPPIISFNGSLPENMINPYFDSFSGVELEKEYLATQIQSYNQAISENGNEMVKMSKRFKKSVLGMLISFFLFGLVVLLRFVECLPS